jgi:hypothetical protein
VEQSAGLNSETEQKITDLQSDAVRSAPNISLNLHGGSKSRDLYWAALCGIVLQSGMLIFSAFTVYNPGFSWRFPVDSNHVRPYAFPVMATGTIILVSGMLICSAVVEYSTEEKRFVAGRKYKKQTQEMKLNARVLWLQQNHVVSDQSFESYVIFGKTKRDYLLSSRRNELEKKRNSCHLMKHVASNRTEAFTVLAVALGIVGFILQFQVILPSSNHTSGANKVWMGIRGCAV